MAQGIIERWETGLQSFAIAAAVSIGLITFCVAVFYEIMAHIWVLLTKFEGHPRTQIFITVMASFLGHTIAAPHLA